MRLAFCVAGALAFLLHLGFGTMSAADSEKERATRYVLNLLEDRVDLKAFREGVGDRDALDLLSKKFNDKGKELPVLINFDAFKKVTGDKQVLASLAPLDF